MKARKVTVTLEVLTALPIKTLRDVEWWKMGMMVGEGDPDLDILQAQVNVIKPSK